MDKNIQNLLKRLKLELLVAWIIVLLTFAVGEMNIIPNGCVVGNEQLEFYLKVVCIVLTIVGIPLSLKFFVLNTTKGLCRLDLDEALSVYHKWNVIRLFSLLFCALFNVVVYFLTLDTTGLLCALIVLLITLVCWPTSEKIRNYLDSCNNEIQD